MKKCHQTEEKKKIIQSEYGKLEKWKYSNQKNENIEIKRENIPNRNEKKETTIIRKRKIKKCKKNKTKNKRIRPRGRASGQKYDAKSSPYYMYILRPKPVAFVPLGQEHPYLSLSICLPII